MNTTISSFRANLSQIDFDDVYEDTLLRFRDHYLDNLAKKMVTDTKSVFLQYYERIKKKINLTEETQQQVNILKSRMLKDIRNDFHLLLIDEMFQDSMDAIENLFNNIKDITLADVNERIAQIPDDKIDGYLADYDDIDIAELLMSKVKTMHSDDIMDLDSSMCEFLDEQFEYIDHLITDANIKDILLEMRKELIDHANILYHDYVDDFIEHTVKEDLTTEIFDEIQLKIIYPNI